MSDDDQWWFDLNTKSAVQGDKVDSKVTDRLGPYGSREEAEQALAKVEERNAAWDADDEWGED